MSSKTGAHPTSRLRKASASHRLNAFLKQIEILESSNFPHPDAREALGKLKDDIKGQIRRLSRSDVSDEALIDRLYAQARNTVIEYTPILGFILRSTNIRNAFEVHFPLKRLAKQVIGANAKLIISSEWNFVPFTYPMTLPRLPQFALVGGPASESGNVLATPVAAHEIGHSAWRVHSPSFALDNKLIGAVDAAISANASQTAALVIQLGTGPLAVPQIRHLVFSNAKKQLEEIFCDAVGLYYFGASFLYALEYFLAPGGGPRSLTYPSDVERLKLLTDGAAALGISNSSPLFERWADSVAQSSQMDFITILDAAVAHLASDVINHATSLLRSRGARVPDQTKIDAAVRSFDGGEPIAGDITLGEIATAGWEIVRREGGLAEASKRRKYRDLGDLMLKSVEVAEFELRIARA